MKVDMRLMQGMGVIGRQQRCECDIGCFDSKGDEPVDLWPTGKQPTEMQGKAGVLSERMSAEQRLIGAVKSVSGLCFRCRPRLGFHQ